MTTRGAPVKILLSLLVVVSIFLVSWLRRREVAPVASSAGRADAVSTLPRTPVGASGPRMARFGGLEMKIEDIRRVGSMDGAVRWVASQAAAHGWKPVSLPSGTPETETRFRRLERDAFLTPDEQLAVFVYTELPGENTVTITRSRFDLKKLKRGMKGGIPQSIPEPKPISVPDALRGVVLGKPLFSLGGTKAEDPLTLVSEVVGDRRTLTKNLAEVFRANGWTLENWTEEKPVRDALDGKALVSATRADAWCQVMVGGHEGRTFATYRLAFSGDALRPGRAY